MTKVGTFLSKVSFLSSDTLSLIDEFAVELVVDAKVNYSYSLFSELLRKAVYKGFPFSLEKE